MRLVAATNGVKNELPEIATTGNWSDVGYVALSWVQRSCSYTRAADTNADTNADTSPTDGSTRYTDAF